MPALDPVAALHGPINFAEKNLANDLNALTEEQATATGAPNVRPAVAIVAECAAVNTLLAGYLATGEIASHTDEDRAAYFACFTTRRIALDELRTSAQALRDAISNFDPAHWGDSITDFFGSPSTPFAFAQVGAMHMMYHDGQINYLHLQHGDTDMHW